MVFMNSPVTGFTPPSACTGSMMTAATSLSIMDFSDSQLLYSKYPKQSLMSGWNESWYFVCPVAPRAPAVRPWKEFSADSTFFFPV